MTIELQAEFQSICTGDYMTVAKKNKTATGVTWRVPGMMGGNAVPGWEDQQGSIVRRIVLFVFNSPVQRVDTHLSAKLLSEMPALLLKCNEAYRTQVELVGSRPIWDVLPEYFKNTQRDMAAVVNSMHGFLASEAVQYNDDYYCPLTDVSKAWSKWVTEQNISPKPRWSADLYRGPIASRGLNIIREKRLYPRQQSGSRRTAQYVIGLDLTAQVVENDENQGLVGNR